jgi:hypothetical protein
LCPWNEEDALPLIPRTKDEILRDMGARLVAQSVLSDTTPSSSVYHDLGTVAEEIEFTEHRMWSVRQAFSFEGGQGDDLDERVSDLPPPSLRRQDGSAASGQSLRLQRTDTVGPLVIEAGAVTVAREDDPDIVYVLAEQVTIADGEEFYPVPDSGDVPALVTALGVGERTNAPQGTLTVLVSGPLELISVNNTEPVTGGSGRETDEELIGRAILYLSSLARCQTRALEYLARTLQTTSAQKIRHAFVYEDPERPGYSELVIDDGSGLVGLTQPGQVTAGVIPENGAASLYFQAPAVNAAQMTLKKNGVPIVVPGEGAELPYTPIEERGLLYIPPALFDPGDTWEISDYDVYTGVIRELQTAVEGAVSDPLERPGWRASGTRVRVVPPVVQWVVFDMLLRIEAGTVDIDEVRNLVIDETIAFLQGLAPGAILFLDALTCALRRLPGILAVRYNLPLTPELTPATPRTVLRTRSDLITVA